MQNPFLRLKHYRTDQKDSDSKENHATEVLAACLALSHRLRADFLSFLFQGDKTFTLEEASECSVETQVQTDDGGWVDLLLELPGVYSIVVEVKVGSPQYGAQIQAYHDWLTRTKTGDHYVFWLVRSPNPAVQIEQFGGKHRRTWYDLYSWFSQRKANYADSVEENLIQHLCDYLEAETIVNTWKPTDLLGYTAGIKAKQTLEVLFKQVEARLLDTDEGYETKIIVKDDPWSRLEIGHKTWTKIFGPNGYRNKIYICFPTTGLDNGGGDQFFFEVQLWNRGHQCDWDLTKKKLPIWIKFLRGQGFEDWVTLREGKFLESDLLTATLTGPPLRIDVSPVDEKLMYLTAQEIGNLSNIGVVDQLVERAVKIAEIVSQLA